MHSILARFLVLGAESAPVTEAAPPGDAAGSMTMLFAVLLLGAAVVLFFLEMFIPSLGVLTVCGIVCAVASVWLGFRHGTGSGLGILVLNADALGGEPGDVPDDAETQALVGKSGAAVTDLRPAGKATIEGRRVDVLTEGAYVARGTRVAVVRVEGNRIFVRAERAG